MIHLSLLHRVFNVSRKEWPRIIPAWALNLFVRLGFVVGWTLTLAMFIHRVGVELLPFLLVLNALLIMVGTIVYSHLLKWVKVPMLILFTTLIGSSLLFLANLFVGSQDHLFFGMILIAQSMFLSQLSILITLFTEDLFSPLESQRTFPLIHSSETMGGILGGFLVAFLSSFLPPYKFIYLWIVFILLIVPVMLIAHSYFQNLPSLKLQKENASPSSSDFVQTLKETFFHVRRIPFLEGIVLVALFQFILFNLFEFQYIKALKESLMNHSSLQSFELELTRNLGILQMIFSAGALIVQLFLASRLISSLGIVSSLLIHPLVTLLNLVGMLWNFNFFTASLGRSNFEITTSVFNNAYHSSYYAIPDAIRSQITEFIQGFIKPFGAIFAFLFMLSIQNFFSGSRETSLITAIMIGISVLMSFRLFALQKDYTFLSHSNLDPEEDLPTRLNAIEILSQKGHRLDYESLFRCLENPTENIHLKVRILETFGVHQNAQTLPEIIACFKNISEDVQLAAVEALLQFNSLKNEMSLRPFTRYHAIHEAKQLFRKTSSQDIRSMLIRLLAKIDQGDLIPFILNLMKSSELSIKRSCIRVCGTFKDPNIIPYVRPYLHHRNPAIRAEALIALQSFQFLRPHLRSILNDLKSHSNRSFVLGALHALGEIGDRQDLPYLMHHLGSSDDEIRYKSTKALCLLNHPASIPHMVSFLMHPHAQWSQRAKKFLHRLDHAFADRIHQLAHRRVSETIHELLNASDAAHLNTVPLKILKQLRRAYATLDAHDDVFKLDQLIQNRSLKRIPDHSLKLHSHAFSA